MADEDKKKPEKETDKKGGVEAESSKAEVSPVPSSLFSKKNIMIFSVMLVVLAAGAFIGIKKMSKKEEEKAHSEKIKEIPAFIFPFETMVVNIAGTQGSRYLKATVAVEFDSEKVEPEIKARTMEILDIINAVLSSKTMEQIISLDAREELKREIRDKINAKISSGQVKNVFFSEYVVQ